MSEKEILEKIGTYLREKKEKDIFEKIEGFRKKRLRKIKKNDTSKPLSEGGKIVIHLIPVESFRSPKYYDLPDYIYSQGILKLNIIRHFTHSYNFDGLFHFFQEKGDKCSAYFQVYTEGMIEVVETRILKSEEKIFPLLAIKDRIINYTKQSLQFQKEFDIKPPIVLYLALLNVAGYKIPELQSFPPRDFLHPVDREDLILPKIIIDKFDIVLEEILKTSFDRIWNACGHDKSEYYDENGKRTKR